MIIMICHKTYKQKQINKNTELNIISLLPSLFNLIFQTSFFNSTYYFDDLIKSNKYIQYLFLKNSIFRIFVGTCLSLCHVMNNCTFTSWKFSIFDWRFIFNNNVFFFCHQSILLLVQMVGQKRLLLKKCSLGKIIRSSYPEVFLKSDPHLPKKIVLLASMQAL